jgi:hypothetical protein
MKGVSSRKRLVLIQKKFGWKMAHARPDVRGDRERKDLVDLLKRKIFLKEQAAMIIRRELQDLRFQAAAIHYRNQLVRRIRMGHFDEELSGRLDTIQSFLDGANLR